MSTLNSILNTGLAGLYTSQSGISVTGKNITNVNTDGYSRQSLDVTATANDGVASTGVTRLTDKYATAQLYGSNARLSEYETEATNLSTLESILGTGDSGDLIESLESFFSALEDLSTDASSTTNRSSFLSAASSLSSTINTTASQISDLRSQLDSQLVSDVDSINSLTSQIAEINGKLAALPVASGSDSTDLTINSLLDQRDALVSELSGYLTITTSSDSTNQLSVYVDGQSLVSGLNVTEIKAVVNSDNDNLHDLVLERSTGDDYVLDSDSLGSGELAGLLKVRDDEAGAALESLDKMAAALARDFNVLHESGTGLDGSTGNDLFDGLSVSASSSETNTGGAEASASSITDLSALTFDDYEIQFSSATAYSVVDKTTGATVTSGTYTSGTAITFGGMSVTLTDSSGTPASGDVFSVNSYAGTATSLSLSSDVEDDTDALACGTNGAAGDTTVVNDMLDLRDAETVNGESYEEYYKNLCVQVGTDSAAATNKYESEEDTNTSLASLASATSGVSLDEEATNLIEFQSAYEAASKLVSTVDEMMATLMNMI